MAKIKKVLSAASRTGRNNKNRGRGFERTVADALGWTRVPYSGGQKEWGGADVVDGFFKKHGLWAAECKTHVVDGDKPAHIRIQDKWISQMLGAETAERHGILVVRRVRRGGKPGVKGPPAYVFMQNDTFDWFLDHVQAAIRKGGLDYAHDVEPLWSASYSTPTTRAKGYNFVVPESMLEFAHFGRSLRVSVADANGEMSRWNVLLFDDFVKYVKTYRIMEYDD